MKKVISLLLTAMLLLSMLPATMAEGVEYIPAPSRLTRRGRDRRSMSSLCSMPTARVNRPSASPMSA